MKNTKPNPTPVPYNNTPSPYDLSRRGPVSPVPVAKSGKTRGLSPYK